MKAIRVNARVRNDMLKFENLYAMCEKQLATIDDLHDLTFFPEAYLSGDLLHDLCLAYHRLESMRNELFRVHQGTGQLIKYLRIARMTDAVLEKFNGLIVTPYLPEFVQVKGE